MNLHNIVSPCIAAVNPPMRGAFMRSSGSSVGASGKRTPTYSSPVAIEAQVQALQYKDLMQLDGININGEKRAMYVNGNWEGVSRPEQKGGDLIVLQDSSVWLIVLVLENWASMVGWNKFAAARQVADGLDVTSILAQVGVNV